MNKNCFDISVAYPPVQSSRLPQFLGTKSSSSSASVVLSGRQLIIQSVSPAPPSATATTTATTTVTATATDTAAVAVQLVLYVLSVHFSWLKSWSVPA